MTMNDMSTLTLWIRIFTVWAAVGVTSVPVMYAFFPWRSRRLGQLFMFKATGHAVAFDVAAIFSNWQPRNVYIIFYSYMFALAWVTVSTLVFAGYMWRLSHPKKKGKHHAPQ